MTPIDKMKEIGEETDLTCPDCGGILYRIKGDPEAYRFAENYFKKIS